ncbi:DUF6799 domain-containing protein [Hymenobacter wooponensis]|uniref:DUF6799 domain-containing protein n=1 Tax=Hymenobacter wooponensis TaxID=1525360 RepID=A0A4Z0MR27_9BACT|nr:DUF6799 domain-containing protein [Hymenobacter wooponensis]TGD81667.1 hypothetical protein EU557_08995 [Hymenobacter wooponensis]
MSLFAHNLLCSVRARCVGLVIFCLSVTTGLAQAQTHDGFQRRDGAMYLVRNGEARPMTRDTHLPNGRIVTRDGFVVERDGKRTELAEGNGCTLLGQPAAITTQGDGRLALLTVGAGRSGAPAVTTQFERWFGKPGRGKAKGHNKKGGKHKHKDRDDD